MYKEEEKKGDERRRKKTKPTKSNGRQILRNEIQ